MNNQMMRSSSDRIISGVCGGLAEYFNIDSAIVRLVFVLAVLSGISPLVYLVLWIVMPEQKPAATRPRYPITRALSRSGSSTRTRASRSSAR